MNDDTLQHTTMLRKADIETNAHEISGFSLTVIRGNDADYGAIYSFDPQEIVIGRSTHAELRLHDQAISKRHCRILLKESDNDAVYMLEDLGSTNGTRLNGILLKSPQEVKSGDRIELGDTVLRFNTQDDLDSEYQSHLLRLATTDPLTSLLNKASLLKELERLLQYAQRYKRPLALLMIDVDHFKKVNDQYGHLVGDQVLTQLALRLVNSLRQQDVAGRFGGEEFTIILPETTLSGARILAERIRESIAKNPFPAKQIELPITISIGIAEYTDAVHSGSQLLEMADQALYQAKNTGRNRTVVHSQTKE